MNTTPGPWRALGASIRPAKTKGHTGGYAPILVAKHDKRLPDNREANAQLAAAAPALYEALAWCLRQMPEPSLPGEYTTGWMAAKVALRQAEKGYGK